jgi:hypothetical protein
MCPSLGELAVPYVHDPNRAPVLGLSEPVDWVGRGGHVGVIFAATSPARCRTLVTAGSQAGEVVAVPDYSKNARLFPIFVGFRLPPPCALA